MTPRRPPASPIALLPPLVLALVLIACAEGDPATVASPASTVTVQLVGPGAGSVASDPPGIDCGEACSAAFPTGSSVALAAVASGDASFGGWEGACSGTDATCRLDLDGGAGVRARFLRTFVLSVSIAGTGAGSVASDPAGIDCGDACSAGFTEGAVVILTAIPAPEATFEGWRGACGGSEPACAVALDRAKAAVAEFASRPPPAPDEARLSVVRTGSGAGAVTSSPSGIACGEACAAAFENGTVVTLEAAPEADATFEGWTGACAGASGRRCELTLQADATVGAVFEPAATDASLRFDGGGDGLVLVEDGTGLCTADCTLPFGEVLTLRAAPHLGSAFGGWRGCDRVAGDRCTLTAPGRVVATFAATDAAALGPVDGDCDGIARGATCSVPVAISTPTSAEVRALEFEVGSPAFTLVDAELGPALAASAGGTCLPAAGPRRVAIVCDAAATLRDGAVAATVILRRDGPLPTVVEVLEPSLVPAVGDARVGISGGAVGVVPSAP